MLISIRTKVLGEFNGEIKFWFVLDSNFKNNKQEKKEQWLGTNFFRIFLKKY